MHSSLSQREEIRVQCVPTTCKLFSKVDLGQVTCGTASQVKSFQRLSDPGFNTWTQQLGALIKQLYYLVKEFRYDQGSVCNAV